MAETTITGLPNASALTGTERVPMDQAGVTVDATTLAIAQTLPDATTGAAGKMTAADKTKLDGLATVATSGAYTDLSGTPSLGTAAAANTGTNAGNVVVLDGSARLPAVDGSQLTGIAGGATNLSYDASTRVLASSTGDDATLPLASTSSAGLAPALGFGTITYASSVALDLAVRDGQVATITLTGSLELTTSNLANGRTTGLRLIPGDTTRTLTFPADWVFVSAKPASLPADKIARLTIECHGTTNADVIAAIAIQP
jgi:hypothetical protein